MIGNAVPPLLAYALGRELLYVLVEMHDKSRQNLVVKNGTEHIKKESGGANELQPRLSSAEGKSLDDAILIE